MRFETDKLIEYGLRLVEEKFRDNLKRQWTGFRQRGAPHWIHRTVVKSHRPQDGMMLVRVKGLCQATNRKRVVDFDCDLWAKIDSRRDGDFLAEVGGEMVPRNFALCRRDGRVNRLNKI